MDDADFDDLLDDYQPDEPTPNFDMLDVEIVWVGGTRTTAPTTSRSTT